MQRTPLPKTSLLHSVAHKEAWDAAYKEALRSPLSRFRAGACIFHPNSKEVISSGCAHPSFSEQADVSSIHAERHALQRAGRDCQGLHITIVTIGLGNRWAWNACPCTSCASLLLARGIAAIHYAVWLDGWQIRSEEPSALLSRAQQSSGPWARNKRIPLAL